MIFFTSDTHFRSMETIHRENRPFKSDIEFDNFVLSLFNEQVSESDTIYHLGDFIDYDDNDKNSWEESLKYASKINCNVILIIGNNEERLINEKFNDSFTKFRDYAINVCGFADVKREDYIEFNDKQFYLNHYPKNHKGGYINLFGHFHKITGYFKPYGLNLSCDLNYFRLYDEEEIERLLFEKKTYWETDPELLK